MTAFVLRHAPGLSVVALAVVCGGFWLGVIATLAFLLH